MRFIPAAAVALAAAFLAACPPEAPDRGGAWPALALFTFAVSAFREPLR